MHVTQKAIRSLPVTSNAALLGGNIAKAALFGHNTDKVALSL